MESMFMNQHGNGFYPDENLDYSFWQVDPWFSHIQPCSLAFSNPFENESPHSPTQDSSRWTQRHEQPAYLSNAETPLLTSPGTEEPPASSSVPPKPPTQAPSLKRRRVVKPTVREEVTERPPIKRARTSRSKSFSSDRSSTEDTFKDKEDGYQERSRMASNKFRARKRNEIAQLESEEYNIEDANRQLRSMLEALTSEILSLKMQILEHTNCNCELIQEYINKEALNFVQNLEGVSS